MNIVTVLMDPILPVAAIMAVGFASGRLGQFNVEQARLINRLAMTLLLPFLLLGLLTEAPIRSFSPWPVLSYLLAEILVFTGGFLLARRVFRRDAKEAVLLAFCGIFANNAFYVLPISILLYGEAGALPVTTVVVLDAVVALGGAMIALQIVELGSLKPGPVLRSLASTPLLQAMVLGVAWNLLGWPVPAPVQTFLDFNGAAAAPLALFALGVVLSETRFEFDPVVVTYSAIKLIAFPLVVWLSLRGLAPVDPGQAQFLLASAGPAGAMGMSMALLHGVRTEAIAQIIVWTSVLSLFSLALLA